MPCSNSVSSGLSQDCFLNKEMLFDSWWSISVAETLQKAAGRWFIPIVEQASLFSKVLSNFCRNLAIGHLVNCFDTDDASTKSFIRETFFELSLCLTGTK